MMFKEINRYEYLSFAILSLLVVLLIWSTISYFGLLPSFFLPAPTKIAKALLELSKGSLVLDILASLSRILSGFLLSLVVAVPIGIGLAISRRLEAIIEPLIAFIRYIPPSAFIPLAIIWFGIGETEKILILFLGIAPYLTLLVADIVLNTRRDLIEAALTLGATQTDVVIKVIGPNSFPAIWDSFRIMIGAGWTYVIIAEIVGASSGLGHLMIESQRFLRTDNIFATIVIIGLLGLTTDYIFKSSYSMLFKWTEKSHA